MKHAFFAIIAVIFFSGCLDISPFSPDSKTRIGEVQGNIDEISTTQDSLVLELQRLQQENIILAEKIENMQQAQGNFIDQNSGVKIGDGLIIGAVVVVVFAMFFIYYYRTELLKQKQTSEILSQQIALYDDEDLNDQIFTAAMNTNAESNIYHMMVKSQGQIAGLKRQHQSS